MIEIVLIRGLTSAVNDSDICIADHCNGID